MRLLVALLAWVVAVAAAAGLSSTVAGSIHTTTSAIGADAGSGAPFDASSVNAADPDSLFRTANFSRALGIARARLGADARLTTVALYPGYLSVTADRAGTEIDFYVNARGSYNSQTGGTPGVDGTVPLSALKADAPATLAARIATAAKLPESQLHYMVIEVDSISKHLQWLVYPLKTDRVEYFRASGAHGSLFEETSAGLRPLRG